MTAGDLVISQSHPGVSGGDDQHAHRKWRERQAWRTGKTSVLSKFVGVGLRFVTVPLSLRLLGSERYGLWLTVGSLLTWLAVYDLGLSSGLLNMVGRAYGRGDNAAIRRHVSTAFLGFASMSLLMLAVVAGASRWAGLPRLLGIRGGSPLGSDARSLVLVCGAIFAVSFCLGCANQFAAALQQGYLAAYGQIGAALLSCVLLAVLSFRGASVTQFAIVMGAPPVLATSALAAYLFFVRYPAFRPSVHHWSFASLRAISGCGTPIFLSQLADMAILYSANLLIANRLGPGQVPLYAVPLSAFMIAGAVCYGLVAPYQPAYAEAMGRGDRGWIRKTAIRVLARNMALISACGAFMILFGRFVIHAWTRGRVTAPRALLAAMAVYFLCAAWASSNGILLIGIGRVKTKAVLQGCVALIHVLGAWLLLPKLGIIAIPVAGTLGYLLDVALSLPLALRYLSRTELPGHATVMQSGDRPQFGGLGG